MGVIPKYLQQGQPASRSVYIVAQRNYFEAPNKHISDFPITIHENINAQISSWMTKSGKRSTKILRLRTHERGDLLGIFV